MTIKMIHSLSFLFLGLFIIHSDSTQASNIETSFDFRFRYGYTDDDSKSAKRRRNRIHTRLGAQYSPNERLKIKIRFATAEENTTGANQTLGHDFSLSDIGMDQLYINFSLMDDTYISLGKMTNPFFKPNKSELLFDGDYTPEGVALSFNEGDIFGNIGFFKFDESSSKTSNILGFQIGLSNKITNQTSYKIALAQYNFDDIKGRSASDITWNGNIFGNPVDANNNYLNNYNVTNFSAEIQTKLGTETIPTTIFLDFARNSEAHENDLGFQIGAKLTLSDLWNVAYLYKDVEKNAVFGALTHSDFGGGGVGHKGHQLNVGYTFSKKLSIEFIWFDNKKEMKIDYKKAFFDLKYKF